MYRSGQPYSYDVLQALCHQRATAYYITQTGRFIAAGQRTME